MRLADGVRAVALVSWMVLTAMSCTTDVELCRMGSHPHSGGVSFSYAFDADEDATDSMFVIANRIVNRRLSAMVVSSATGDGKFLLGGTEASADTVAAGDSTAAAALSSFDLPVGDYRFMTFNLDTTELKYDDLYRFIARGDTDMGMDEIYVEYRSYDKEEPGLRETLPDWQDYNPYSGYIQPNMRSVLLDTVAAPISVGRHLSCHFRPVPKTQNIDLYFNIQKKEGAAPFIVDSVMGEISGLPYRIRLVTGDLDISKTYKMMFRMDCVDASGAHIDDTYSASSVRCHGNINVPGLVPGRSADVTTGPGIMQVIIYVHTTNPADSAETLVKKLQGKINLYNTLRDARLIDYTDDMSFVRRTASHGVLNIKANLIIDGETIIENPDNDWGIDSWISCSDIVVDI